MVEDELKEQDNIRRAFELAYFIHADSHIAFRVTEAAVSKLDHTFGKQGRRVEYVPEGRPQSRGTKGNALRTKVSLRKGPLLQLLVYAESEVWERYTEHEADSDRVTNEDMIIRFIKHLVQITVKRNSFYVTLGIGRLLYEYDTSQVRQLYDVLMQDHARFRDNSYLRKQKRLLMRELIDRFGSTIRLVKTPQRESRFVTQPTTDALKSLVYECLRRFTPWDTSCTVPSNFDPTARIPALAFLGTDPDKESPVEMNRIHSILDPNCFSRLISGLGLDSPDQQLAIPQFHFSNDRGPRGDRFNPPPFTPEDQAKLRRKRDSNARRRSHYQSGPLRIYIDHVESVSFDPSRTPNVVFKLRPGANVIEIRGTDADGELPLATLLVSYEDIPVGKSLEDSLVLEGGQKISIILTPIRNSSEKTTELNAEITYTETQLLRAISRKAHHVWAGLFGNSTSDRESSKQLKSPYSKWVGVGLAMVVLCGLIVTAIFWRSRQMTERSLPGPIVKVSPAPTNENSPAVVPVPVPVESGNKRPPPNLLVRAMWDNSEGVSEAIRIEAGRGDPPSIDISPTTTTLHVALSRTDADDRSYQRYRLVLSAAEKPIWQSTIRAPRIITGTPAHLLTLELLPQHFPKSDFYELTVHGQTQGNWQILGKVTLKVRSR